MYQYYNIILLGPKSGRALYRMGQKSEENEKNKRNEEKKRDKRSWGGYWENKINLIVKKAVILKQISIVM